MLITYAESLKINALARIAPFMNVSKKGIIMKSFTESQLGYCPLICMFHSRGLHERALRITYNDRSSSYRELLTTQSHTGNFPTTFK